MPGKITDKIMKGAREAAAHARGEAVAGIREYRVQVPGTIDVAEIRKRCGMTQAAFARTFGFAHRTLASWENGERTPEGPARVLLKMIARDADAVIELAR